MAFFEPKQIYLGEKLAITGNKVLIFVDKKDFAENRERIYSEIRKSFKERDNEGLLARADLDTLSVTILPTMNCNLRCVYCYADGGSSNANLSFEDAKYVIDQLIKRYPVAKKINLYFAGGGEPLLNFELIQNIVQYVKDCKLTLTIRMVTNGTLVPDYLDWLRANKVYLRISYDGSTQSITRPGVKFDSQKRLTHTFDVLQKEYVSAFVSLQMIATRFNVGNLPDDVFNLITQYDIDSIKVEAVKASASERSKTVDSPDPLFFANQLIKVLDKFIENNVGGSVNTSYLSLPGINYFCALRNKIIISPLGYLGSCVEFIDPKQKNNLILCKIDKGKDIDFNKIREFQKKNLFHYYPKNYKVCSDCNLVHICKGNCPARLIVADKKEGPFSFDCTVSHKLIPAFLKKAADNEDYLRLILGDEFTKYS